MDIQLTFDIGSLEEFNICNIEIIWLFLSAFGWSTTACNEYKDVQNWKFQIFWFPEFFGGKFLILFYESDSVQIYLNILIFAEYSRNILILAKYSSNYHYTGGILLHVWKYFDKNKCKLWKYYQNILILAEFPRIFFFAEFFQIFKKS